MRGSIEILKAGLMTSLQDLGRQGLAYYAIPRSGSMDHNAASIALLLLNRKLDEAVIEITSLAPTIKFNDATEIALSGADFGWVLNDKLIPVNQVIRIEKGDLLKGGSAKKGLRGYMAIGGKWNVDPTLGSYSTYKNASLGGYEGRLLKKGDVIYWESEGEAESLPFYKGPEFEYLTEEAKAVLTSETFTVGMDTDRMGMRLEGLVLEASSYQLPFSAPILPGFIQLTPSGYPIIVLHDGQTTGGYPRIGYLKSEALSTLNQIPIRGKVRFRKGN